ncbi:AraC family transcriptional regulator [Raoultella sp. WB_B2P2-3]|uniref:AraC family transcriptional regulator n=1 Tax=Raoultella scottii TaxID=3040937 RepID=A0ABU8ZAT2_9ENTR|nr:MULTISPECIES: AraC family transcriptional regulator [Enterobacteriaceae]MVT01980.1 helix-turn-helix domain-containing protein [Raoultella sp. 10-1]PAC14499.1 AraC family transcriptional regulator [Enterobacter sp. 10-1]
MIADLPEILHRLVNQQDTLQVRFPEPDVSVPELAYKVPFPRLEIVLDGELRERGLPLSDSQLRLSQALYVQAGKWTLPEWTGPASTLSILFGRQKLGFCIQRWDGKQLHTEKQNVARLGPRVGSYLLLALNEICLQPDPVTARLVVSALLSHCLEQLVGLEMRVSRSRDLFLAVQDFLEDNLSQPLTRESVAKRFHITPNYLSHIFQKSGSVGFNEYLTSVRLEKAKKLLRGYDLKVKEIAHNCGFVDSNYFCRVFKRYTERSPSEYRRHCRSAQQA